MSVTLQEVISDLRDEQAALGAVLDRIPPKEWDEPTHAVGWMVRDQVTHLAFFDEKAAQSIRNPAAFAAELNALDSLPDQEERYLRQGRGMTHVALLEWWHRASADLIEVARTLDAKTRMPWYGPDMNGISFITARLMETWSHGLDVVDAVHEDRPDTDRLRHVAFLGVRTRAFSYTNRGLAVPETPVRVELTVPGGGIWVFGDQDAEALIKGSATDFCRVVTQRRHVADTRLEMTGAAAEEWMIMAQAFAGPPGPGRDPGEFAELRTHS